MTPDPKPPPDPEGELRKATLEWDRKDAESVRVHQRELEKIATQHANTKATSAATAEAQLLADQRKAEQQLVADQRKAEQQLVAEQEKAETQLRADRIKASAAADEELNKLFHEKVAEVAVASVERARDSAKFVQTAATAIFAVYTGLLALVFSVTDNPLPLRGAWAGVFLGLSIAFATAYLAFLTDVPDVRMSWDSRSVRQTQYSQTANLTNWIKTTVHRRTYATRAAVISLLFGVLFIAAPFVSTAAPASTPPLPTAPSPPGSVDDEFEDLALQLFEAQIEDYENAVAARAASLAAAEAAAADRSEKEAKLNDRVTSAAFAALLIVLLGPLLYGLGERAWHAREKGGGADGTRRGAG